MCGTGGAVNTGNGPVPGLQKVLKVMGESVAHRGPDGIGEWQRSDRVQNVQLSAIHRPS